MVTSNKMIHGLPEESYYKYDEKIALVIWEDNYEDYRRINKDMVDLPWT